MTKVRHGILLGMLATGLASGLVGAKTNLGLVERMPRSPRPWRLIDWHERARLFDALAFDEKATGQYLPLVRVREKGRNIPGPVFDLPTFVGASPDKASEAINCLAAVAGGLLVGIDKGNQNGRDWVGMCLDWYPRDAGVVVNNASGRPGNSFWYDLFPSVLFFELADLQPKRAELSTAMRATAEHWRDAVVALGGPAAEFNHTAFRFASMTGYVNGKWREPDAAAGLAWLMHAAWRRFGDPRFLEASRWCLDYLERWDEARGNPGYEVLHYYAPIVAARMNAEAGGHYDVQKMLGWSFSENLTRPTARPNWGMIAERWGHYDVHGLLGSTRDGGGYAFAMNSFQAVAALAPVVRYQTDQARMFGRWLLNVANNARLFYPDQWPAVQQSSPEWKGSPAGAIAYEGLRKHPRVQARRVARPDGVWAFELPDQVTQATGHCAATVTTPGPVGAFIIECDEGAGFRDVGRWPRQDLAVNGKHTVAFAVSSPARNVSVRLRKQGGAGPTPGFRVSITCFLESSPFATGDPQVLEWGSPTDLGLYGSSHVGFLAAVVGPTNVPGTVRANLTATDFFREAAYPTWLYYNPRDQPVKFSVKHEGSFDLYDAVSHRFLVRAGRDQAEFSLESDAAAVIVVVPAGRSGERRGSELRVDGVVIDYHAAGIPGR